MFKRFEMRLSVIAEHRVQVLNWALNWVFVRSGAGGGEGELGLILLSVRHGSLCTEHGAPVLSSAFPRLVFECFKLFLMFKLERLKNTCK